MVQCGCVEPALIEVRQVAPKLLDVAVRVIRPEEKVVGAERMAGEGGLGGS
jgi:hypothetical protein